MGLSDDEKRTMSPGEKAQAYYDQPWYMKNPLVAANPLGEAIGESQWYGNATKPAKNPEVKKKNIAAAPGGHGASGLDALLAAGGQPQGQPALQDPFIDPSTNKPYTSEQLARSVNVGGTSQSSTQVTKGVQSLPSYQQSMERFAGQQKRAQMATAEAQARGAQLQAAVQFAHQARLQAHQEEQKAAHAEQMARVEQLDAEAAKIREQVAQEKIDPDQWWSNRTDAQRTGFALATALSGFAAAYRGGQNPVLGMIDRAITRDIDAQKANLANKRASLADTRGALADVYRKIGDMRQAEQQTRILMLEGLKSKLAGIASETTSQAAIANAQTLNAQIDMRVLEAKNQAYQQGQDRVVKSSSSSSQRVPLFKILQAQKAAQEKNGGKPLPAPKEKIREKAAVYNATRKHLVTFLKKYKELGVPSGITAWWGGQADAVEQLKKLTIDKIVLSMGGSTEHLKMLKKVLGGGTASDADIKERVSNLLHDIDTDELAMFEAEAGNSNIAPLLLNAKKYKDLSWSSVGGGKH